jgi:hypothetical protein
MFRPQKTIIDVTEQATTPIAAVNAYSTSATT